jgi:hypothetical protein
MTEEAKAYIASESFVEGLDCLKHEVPWIVPEAIYKLEELLNRHDYVYEVGGGGSTIFYARHCMWVDCIETDYDWAYSIFQEQKIKVKNVRVSVLFDEQSLIEDIKEVQTDHVTVFSVDTQGGEYNRSAILNAFLGKGISDNLRIIILDNYGHEGLFPDHYNKNLMLGDGWEVKTCDHPRWAGNGTKIYFKK